MDKVFSTRLDENLIRQIDRFVKSRSISKKSLIEKALRLYINSIGEKLEHDMIDRSFGAWKREETAEKTWSQGRQTLNKSFKRHSTD